MPSFDPGRLTALTFDCFGTLIDWETGAIDTLRPLLFRHRVELSDDQIIAVFEEIESQLCSPPYRSYKAVLAGVIEGFGQRFGFPIATAERNLLASSLPSWKPFPDTVETLRALADRYRLAIISNIDDDLFAATARQLEASFDHVVTAQQVQFYKPHIAPFEEALCRLSAEPGTLAHVAEGATEILPARHLGCATVWVRRHGRPAKLLTEAPDLEVPDLRSLLAAIGVGS